MSLISKLPPRDKPERTKRVMRFRSEAHKNHVRSHACVKCGCQTRGMIQVAHVRFGSDTGMGQKPHDFLTVSLCGDCHTLQHSQGELSFWAGFPLTETIEAFIRTSPRRREIEAFKLEWGL